MTDLMRVLHITLTTAEPRAVSLMHIVGNRLKQKKSTAAIQLAVSYTVERRLYLHHIHVTSTYFFSLCACSQRGQHSSAVLCVKFFSAVVNLDTALT